MGLLAVIVALEVSPMVTLIRWRIHMKRGQAPDARGAPWLANICTLQAVLVVLMVLAAAGMARGL